MPHEITVDTTNETATVEFVDDHGDTTTTPPNFASVNFTSSDDTVLTVAADAANALQGDLTPVIVGTGVTISAQPVDADGQPLLEADGTTPFPTVTSDAIDVNPGAAAGERLTVGPA